MHNFRKILPSKFYEKSKDEQALESFLGLGDMGVLAKERKKSLCGVGWTYQELEARSSLSFKDIWYVLFQKKIMFN